MPGIPGPGIVTGIVLPILALVPVNMSELNKPLCLSLLSYLE